MARNYARTRKCWAYTIRAPGSPLGRHRGHTQLSFPLHNAFPGKTPAIVCRTRRFSELVLRVLTVLPRTCLPCSYRSNQEAVNVTGWAAPSRLLLCLLSATAMRFAAGWVGRVRTWVPHMTWFQVQRTRQLIASWSECNMTFTSLVTTPAACRWLSNCATRVMSCRQALR